MYNIGYGFRITFDFASLPDVLVRSWRVFANLEHGCNETDGLGILSVL